MKERQSELTEEVAGLQQGDHLCLFYEQEAAEQMPALVPFIQDGLARDEGRPYPGAFWQGDFEELPAVVADGQRQFGHHLAIVGDHRGQTRVVNQRLQHFGMGEALCGE